MHRTASRQSAARNDASVRAASAERMHIVITGHVDHGSTVIGRLLADTGSLPDGKLALVRTTCERNAKPFEYAFLLDALKDEQAQGITIDAARVFFKTARRSYVIVDAPGHLEFLKNMVTGASRAEAALLVIDAREGIQENSRRHAFMLAMLGIRQIAVLVNKMDLVGYSRDVFQRLAAECHEFLGRIGVTPAWCIPVSGFLGDNLVARSATLPWYDGPTVLDALETFDNRPPLTSAPFRMPVQGITASTINLSMYIIPSLVIGVPVGAWIIKHVNTETFRRICMSLDAWLVAFGLASVLRLLHVVDAATASGLFAVVVAIDAWLLYRFFSAQRRAPGPASLAAPAALVMRRPETERP